MENQDIRWVQRFENYTKAFAQLKNAVQLANERQLSELEQQGLIQAFEYTHELAWKVLKDFLNARGNKDIYGSKDATRAAFKYGLILDGDIWMDMIKSRNQSSHTYNQETKDDIVNEIISNYENAFENLLLKFQELKSNE